MEDDFEHMKSMDSKKSNKPLMEKKRRARINTCLVELKSLILETLKKDASTPGYNKLEKADILELTVKYLRDARIRRDASRDSADNTKMYQAGYSACAKEISQYMNTVKDIDQGLRARVLNHVITTLNNLHNSSSVSDVRKNSVDNSYLAAATDCDRRPCPSEDGSTGTTCNSRESSPLIFSSPRDTSTPLTSSSQFDNITGYNRDVIKSEIVSPQPVHQSRNTPPAYATLQNAAIMNQQQQHVTQFQSHACANVPFRFTYPDYMPTPGMMLPQLWRPW